MVESRNVARAERLRFKAWGDAPARAQMRDIAVDLCHRTGWGLCAIEVVRPEGLLEFVAIVGATPDGEKLLGTGSELRHMMGALREGRDYGAFTFVAAERMSQETLDSLIDPVAVPDIPVSEDPTVWHPFDMCVAQVRDDSGELRALVYLDLPPDLIRPQPDNVDEFVALTRTPLAAVLMLIEREQFASHLRLHEARRRIQASVEDQQGVAALMQGATEELRDAFNAVAFDAHLYGDPVVQATYGLDEDLLDDIGDAARRAWEGQNVVIMEHDRVWGDETLHELRGNELGPLLDERQFSAVILAPIGHGDDALGVMIVARGIGGRRWTDAEGSAALGLGADLGRAIVNARAAQRERDLLRKVRALDELRRNFLRTLTHEIKTPLTVIGANTELLADSENFSDAGVVRFEAIERAVDRLDGMVDALALLGSVTDPDRVLTPLRTDVWAVVGEVVHSLNSVAEIAGITLEVEEPETTLWVNGDHKELAGAFTNLIENAIKYSTGPAKVWVWGTLEGDEVVFHCRDEGLGIDQSELRTIFTPLYRTHNPEAVSRPGTGLGLDIVDTIVDRHGGRVEVESIIGVGSTFRIRLPYLMPE